MRSTGASMPASCSAAQASSCQLQEPAFATWKRPRCARARERDQGGRQVAGDRRREHLVVHDAQRLAGAGLGQDAVDEGAALLLAATAAEHAARAHDQVIGAARRDQRLARELRGAVDAERPRRVVLAVGPAGAAVEDVVGRDVHQQRTRARARPAASQRGASAFTAKAASTSVSAASTPVPGRGVEDDVRGDARHQRRDGRRVGDVDLGASRRPRRTRCRAGPRSSRPSWPSEPATSALMRRSARPASKSFAVSPPLSCVVSASVTFE